MIVRADGRRVGWLCTRIILLSCCGTNFQAQMATKLSASSNDFSSDCLLARISRRRILDRSSRTALQNNAQVAHPTRFERATFAFGAWRSIQLATGAMLSRPATQ